MARLLLLGLLAIAPLSLALAADAQAAMCSACETVYTPNPENRAVYAQLYALYMKLHDSFGTSADAGKMGDVMKELIAIRERGRAGS